MTTNVNEPLQPSDQLARIAEGVREQTRALDEQRTAIVDLDNRMASMERALTGDGAAGDSAEVLESLQKIRSSLKSMRGTEKRGMARVSALLARVSVSLDPSVDPKFQEIATPLMNSRRTMLDYDRLFTLWEASRNAAAVAGAAAEVGTFQGGSAALLSQALHLFAGAARELHVVDTFEGHLESSFTQHDDEQHRGKFGQARFDDVRAFLGAFPGTHVYRGDGPVVVAGWPERRYALAHLDVDLYQPTIELLRYFAPRVVPNGIIVVDDYEAAACPGISLAVHEYLATDRGFQTWRMRAEQIVLVKR